MRTKSFTIQFIPHNDQRYETCGDWQYDVDGNHIIYVSSLPDQRMSWLIGFHELAEFMLCLDRGIKQEDVDAFDIQYEKEREEGLHEDWEEPGYDPRAIYKKEHFFAESVERQLSMQFGIDWSEYDKKVMSLKKETP